MSVSKLQSSHQFLGDLANNNRAHNPEFWLAQRNPGALTAATTVSVPNYGFDQWRLQSSGAQQQIQRVAVSPSSRPSGMNAAYAGEVLQLDAGYTGMCQFHESQDTVPLQGQEVTLGMWLQGAAAFVGVQARLVLLAWTGTADALTSSIVTAWNAGAAPTYAAGYTEIAASTVTLTSSLQQLRVQGTVPTACNNLVLFVHTTASVAASVSNVMTCTGVQLFAGSDLPPFYPRMRQAELALCQRYCLVDAQPNLYADGYGAAASGYVQTTRYNYPVTMRASPTVTLPGFSYSNILSNSVVLQTQSSSGFSTYAVNSAAGRFAYYSNSGQLTADAGL